MSALQIAARLQLKVHGCIVASVFFTASKEQMQALQHAVAHMLRPDGSAILQVKDQRKTPSMAFIERVVAKKASHWRPFTPCKGPRRFEGQAFGAWMHDPQFTHTREWSRLLRRE